jgi:peptidyl-prolyl cis-trans isomerase D
VLKLESLTPAPEIADYNQYKNQLMTTRSGRADYLINDAITEKAEVKDFRYKFM